MFKNFFNFRKKEKKSTTLSSSAMASDTQIPLSDTYARAFLNQPYSSAGRFGWHDIQAAAAWKYYSSCATVRDAVDTCSSNYKTVPYGILDTETDVLYSKYDRSVPATEILTLLRNPNQNITESSLKGSLYASYAVTGDIYLVVTSTDSESKPLELYYINSKNVNPATNVENVAIRYSINTGIFRDNYNRVETDDDRIIYINDDGDRQLIHIKTFNPEDQCGDVSGLSPLSSLFYELEQLIALSINNNSLLRNGLRPGLALTAHKPDGEFEALSDDQIELIKKSAISMYAGVNNTGNVMVLDGISSVTEIALKNRDMQFLEMYRECQLQVYRNLNIPLPFVNADSQTYNNFREAKLSFYDLNIIPFAIIIADELNRVLMPRYDNSGRYKLVVDKERIPAVSELRKDQEDQLKTLNERRVDIGLEEIDKDFIVVGTTPIQLSGEEPLPESNNQEDLDE